MLWQIIYVIVEARQQLSVRARDPLPSSRLALRVHAMRMTVKSEPHGRGKFKKRFFLAGQQVPRPTVELSSFSLSKIIHTPEQLHH